MHERAEWLVEHPFSPPAETWLLLPLGTRAQRLGVVIGGAHAFPTIDAGAAAVLRMLGDLLGAGIEAARLRRELERTAVERERLRLAAEVHDGLAQDLALAVRELALLDSGPTRAVVEASQARLRAAVISAHQTVRARLAGIIAASTLAGLQPALQELQTRFAERGLRVTLGGDERLPEVPPDVTAVALRVLSEALTNVENHDTRTQGLSLRRGPSAAGTVRRTCRLARRVGRFYPRWSPLSEASSNGAVGVPLSGLARLVLWFEAVAWLSWWARLVVG